MADLPRLVAERRSGLEPFSDGPKELSLTLHDFWCWSTSDLLSNMTRGVLAEFLVATALGIATSGVRDPWASYDLVTAAGVRLEVKSAAYLQSWAQRQASRIVFAVSKTRAWDPDTNTLAAERRRQSDVYVFALLAHREKNTVNPLDVAQWQFFTAPTCELDHRVGEQRTISASALRRAFGDPVAFRELPAAVERAFNESRHVG